jgi:hypothetical protein
LGDEDRFALPASRAFERMFFAVRQDPFDSDQPQWIAAGVTEWAVDGFWSMRSDSGAAILIHSGIPFEWILIRSPAAGFDRNQPRT